MINDNISDNIHDYIVCINNSGDIAKDIALDILLRYGHRLTEKELMKLIDEHGLIDYSDNDEKEFQLASVKDEYHILIDGHDHWCGI